VVNVVIARKEDKTMKTKMQLGVLFAFVTLSLMFSGSAHALSMDAGAAMTGGFLRSWTDTHPDITTVSTIYFKTNAVNFVLYPDGVTGDFYWNGSGTQPDYTMDPDGGVSQYAGHIGGSTSSLAIGNQSFDPNGSGKDFLTWYVDVPSTGETDMIHFDLISEIIISKSTEGNTKNISMYLLGYVWDDDGHWSESLSSLNLTVSETVVGENYGYSWAATWASPPGAAPAGSTVPEPAAIILLSVGLTLLIAAALLRKIRKESVLLPV